MPGKESLYPADWLRIAEKDYTRVEHLLNIHDPEAAGFYLQQAIEKFLKAFLLSKGWQLQRVHDLEPLLNEAIKHNPSYEHYRAMLQRISGFYLLDRYPLALEFTLTEEDVQQAISQTKPLIDSIRSILKP